MGSLDKIKDRISFVIVVVVLTFLFTLATHLQVIDLRGKSSLPTCEGITGFGHTKLVTYNRFKMEIKVECDAKSNR